ncbi:polymorphic toxin type 33 domain-containing protein [Nocardia vinacea]|uniref:Polymorphic toxin type 33 domain-containing protein n=1 Tax=Nocardia vinacea TaxID=96468 RepID=A0ABZ1YMK0_9NOCA|nr:polymorphic toxin type 33 domain-containing protein [Nocardia vinacea]
MVGVAPQTYYSAADECYAISKAFQDVYNPLQKVLLTTGGMAGGYQAIKAWASGYDERVGAFTLFATNFARALQRLGDVLTAAGYNWACGEYKANRSPNKDDRPTLPRALPTELPYGAGSVIGVASAHANSRGLESEFPGLYEKVVAQVASGEIPDSDTDKFDRVAKAWKTFASHTSVFGAQTRLRLVAEGLEQTYSSDAPEDIPYLVDHLRTLATSAGDIELASSDFAASTEKLSAALSTMRTDINTQFTAVVVSASVVIAVSAVVIRNPQSVTLEGVALETAAAAIARAVGTFLGGLSGIGFSTGVLATGGLLTIAGLGVLITSIDDSAEGEPEWDQTEERTRNPAQDKPLTNRDIRELKARGHDPHDIKPDPPSRYDLYKDGKGNVYYKPKGGAGAGESTGIRLR